MGNGNNHNHINEVMNRDIADSAAIATVNELKSKTNVNDQTAYIIADPFTSNPSQLLGKVIEIRKSNNGECPTNLVKGSDLNFEFSPFSVTGLNIDQKTEQSKPELRSSIIVDKALCAEVGFLNFLSAQLNEKSTFSLMVFDQAKGLVIQDDTWEKAVNAWVDKNQHKMADPEICYIYVVIGFVQKNIIKKKYIQFEAGARGGAYGVNINGKLSTSTEDYSVDIIFGLTPAIIKRPTTQVNITGRSLAESDREPLIDELKLFARTTGAEVKKESEE